MPINFAPISLERERDTGESPLLKALQQGMAMSQKRKAFPVEMELKKAEAASKNAYSNLMMPQYLAKVLGNSDAFRALSPSAQSNLVNTISRTLPSMNQNSQNVPTNESSLGSLGQSIKNLFGRSAEQNNQQNMPQPPQNAQQQLEQPQAENISPPQMEAPNLENMSPQERQFHAKRKEEEEKASGRESSTLREKRIDELSGTYNNGVEKQKNINELANLVGSPEWSKLHQLAGLNKQELSYYRNFGTPEQKALVGKYDSLTGNIIKANARDFGGAFRVGEQTLLNGMKPSINDAPDVAKGKIEALSLMNQFVYERAGLTAEIMDDKNVSFLKAQKMADQQLNGEKSSGEEIKSKLYPAGKESKSEMQEVEIFGPDGRVVARGSKEAAAKFLKQHRGHYQKVMNNG